MGASLFLGGWHGPLPVTQWLGLTADHGALAAFVGQSLGAANFLFKCTLGVLFMMWLRWSLPRLRIDQVMAMCWKYCVPLAAAMFVGAVLWSYWLPSGLLPLGKPLGSVPEPSAVVLRLQGDAE
ncbi:MAG: hypothetical protein D6741_11050 [Planctomycetota bacterium]|nr:MAG: hypothetical protein D6741_11050 [Planctomycetota bacterium]